MSLVRLKHSRVTHVMSAGLDQVAGASRTLLRDAVAAVMLVTQVFRISPCTLARRSSASRDHAQYCGFLPASSALAPSASLLTMPIYRSWTTYPIFLGH